MHDTQALQLLEATHVEVDSLDYRCEFCGVPSYQEPLYLDPHGHGPLCAEHRFECCRCADGIATVSNEDREPLCKRCFESELRGGVKVIRSNSARHPENAA